MDLHKGFKDKSGNTTIKYVVAYWNKAKKVWFPRGTFDEIEEAKTYYIRNRKMHSTAKFAIFEHIKSETITQIYIPEE